MGLGIAIQDMNHKVEQRFSDDAENTLYFLCAAQPKTCLLRGIDRHADTMFNRWQLMIILDQLAEIDVETLAQRQAVEQLRRLAEVAIRENGYLMFIGD